jgi:hypothetical protein
MSLHKEYLKENSLRKVFSDIRQLGLGAGLMVSVLTILSLLSVSMGAVSQTVEEAKTNKLDHITLKLDDVVSYEQCIILLSHFRWYCDALQSNDDTLRNLGHPFFDSEKIRIAWFDFDQDMDEDLLVSLVFYGCGVRNCPFELLFDRRGLAGEAPIENVTFVASAPPFDPSVVFAKEYTRMGLRFSEGSSVFWVDSLLEKSVNK